MGFFNIQAEIPVAPKKGGCDVCSMDRSGVDAPFAGDGADRILILSDFPTKYEGNGENELFNARHYDYFWKLQGKRGLPKFFCEKAWIGYVIPCHKGNKEPDYSCCTARLERLINELKPHVIIPMGPMAIQALIWNSVI